MSNQITKQQDVRTSIAAIKPQIQAALPQHINADRFIRTALTAIQTNPSLMECNRNSLLAAVLKASQDGLNCDGREAALVPFKGNVQYIPMLGGILKKIRNSGELVSITAQMVYSNDQFSYWVDNEGEHITHTPDLLCDDRGAEIGAYAIATTKDKGVYIEVMTSKQLISVRDVSRAKEFGPWSGPFADEMKKKTVIKRLAKRLPMSTDIEQTLQSDNETFFNTPIQTPIQETQTNQEQDTQEQQTEDQPTRLLEMTKHEPII